MRLVSKYFPTAIKKYAQTVMKSDTANALRYTQVVHVLSALQERTAKDRMFPMLPMQKRIIVEMYILSAILNVKSMLG